MGASELFEEARALSANMTWLTHWGLHQRSQLGEWPESHRLARVSHRRPLRGEQGRWAQGVVEEADVCCRAALSSLPPACRSVQRCALWNRSVQRCAQQTYQHTTSAADTVPLPLPLKVPLAAFLHTHCTLCTHSTHCTHA